MRDAVARFDFCSYLCVAVFLFVAALQIAAYLPRYAPGMAWAAIVTLLAVGARGYVEVRPDGTYETFGVAIVAWIAASAAALAAAALLPPFVSLYDGWKEAAEQRRQEELARQQAALDLAREIAARRQEEQEKREAEEAERRKPPPPTPSELRAAARAEYEREVAANNSDPNLDEIEREAANLAAKQKYLDRIDRGV